ncbi:unnamed protein product, partial [Ectocarpus sp. 12 AP-2014]
RAGGRPQVSQEGGVDADAAEWLHGIQGCTYPEGSSCSCRHGPPAQNIARFTAAAAADVATGGDVGGESHDQEGAKEVQEEESWTVEDMRLISLAEKLPRASLTTIRRGTWVLLEAF